MILNERAVSAYFSEEAYSKAAEMLGGAMFAGEAAIIRALMRASKPV